MLPTRDVPASATGIDRTADQASATGAASAIAPALAAAVGKRTYCSGIQISGGGATVASDVQATITGLLGGTMTVNIPVPAGATGGIAPIVIPFNPPLPASADNTAITLNVPSFGAGNTISAASIWGYRQ